MVTNNKGGSYETFSWSIHCRTVYHPVVHGINAVVLKVNGSMGKDSLNPIHIPIESGNSMRNKGSGGRRTCFAWAASTFPWSRFQIRVISFSTSPGANS